MGPRTWIESYEDVSQLLTLEKRESVVIYLFIKRSKRARKSMRDRTADAIGRHVDDLVVNAGSAYITIGHIGDRLAVPVTVN